MKFKENDVVYVKHQKELGEFKVVNPCDPTDIKRVGGEAVGYYVRIGSNNLGYHEDSLELKS
jgi:hypothetical protein